MKKFEFKKSIPFNVGEGLEYVPRSVVIKTIIRKASGHVSAVAFDSGEALIGSLSPFDTFIQIIEGKAEMIIDNKSYSLETGQCVVVPAHCRNTITADVRFKMLSTIVKSGYEEAA